MKKLSEGREPNKKFFCNFESNEIKRRALFIRNHLKENFGEGKFYSKLKSYGCGDFSINE